jgi:hypothetical protein
VGLGDGLAPGGESVGVRLGGALVVGKALAVDASVEAAVVIEGPAQAPTRMTTAARTAS